MTLKIGALTKLGLFFPVVCFISVWSNFSRAAAVPWQRSIRAKCESFTFRLIRIPWRLRVAWRRVFENVCFRIEERFYCNETSSALLLLLVGYERGPHSSFHTSHPLNQYLSPESFSSTGFISDWKDKQGLVECQVNTICSRGFAMGASVCGVKLNWNSLIDTWIYLWYDMIWYDMIWYDMIWGLCYFHFFAWSLPL